MTSPIEALASASNIGHSCRDRRPERHDVANVDLAKRHRWTSLKIVSRLGYRQSQPSTRRQMASYRILPYLPRTAFDLFAQPPHGLRSLADFPFAQTDAQGRCDGQEP